MHARSLALIGYKCLGSIVLAVAISSCGAPAATVAPATTTPLPATATMAPSPLATGTRARTATRVPATLSPTAARPTATPQPAGAPTLTSAPQATNTTGSAQDPAGVVAGLEFQDQRLDQTTALLMDTDPSRFVAILDGGQTVSVAHDGKYDYVSVLLWDADLHGRGPQISEAGATLYQMAGTELKPIGRVPAATATRRVEAYHILSRRLQGNGQRLDTVVFRGFLQPR